MLMLWAHTKEYLIKYVSISFSAPSLNIYLQERLNSSHHSKKNNSCKLLFEVKPFAAAGEPFLPTSDRNQMSFAHLHTSQSLVRWSDGGRKPSSAAPIRSHRIGAVEVEFCPHQSTHSDKTQKKTETQFGCDSCWPAAGSEIYTGCHSSSSAILGHSFLLSTIDM